MKRRILAATIFLTCLCTAWAQPSPRGEAAATLDDKSVVIEYGRPALNGRAFDELTRGLPPDRMWRAGSEQVTTLTTEADLIVGGHQIPAGKYSLYVYCPEDGAYALAVNRVLGQPLVKIWSAAPADLANEPWPHFSYDEEIRTEEVARIPLREGKSEKPVDRFTISLEGRGSAATLRLEWGERVWWAPVLAR